MKKADLKKLVAEAQAIERGELAPGRVWEVKKLPGGKIVRRQLDPEAYRRKQAGD